MQNSRGNHRPDAERRLFTAASRLLAATIAYNLIEAAVALFAGSEAGSEVLVGFGFDSLIEVAASWIVIWRLRLEERKVEDAAEILRAEHRAHRFVGATFFLLAGYIVVEAGRALILAIPPKVSLTGIFLAILSLIVMPFLAHRKLHLARSLQSRSLEAEAKETIACAYLSLTLLLGLTLHALQPGFWRADPIAALLMIPWLLHEGREAWR